MEISVKVAGMASSRIVQEIQQTKPLPSIEQEVGVALMKTADHLRRLVSTVFDSDGVTHQQYKVLRILRGAGKAGRADAGGGRQAGG